MGKQIREMGISPQTGKMIFAYRKGDLERRGAFRRGAASDFEDGRTVPIAKFLANLVNLPETHVKKITFLALLCQMP